MGTSSIQNESKNLWTTSNSHKWGSDPPPHLGFRSGHLPPRRTEGSRLYSQAEPWAVEAPGTLSLAFLGELSSWSLTCDSQTLKGIFSIGSVINQDSNQIDPYVHLPHKRPKTPPWNLEKINEITFRFMMLQRVRVHVFQTHGRRELWALKAFQESESYIM